jgi:hypothetical protein
VRCLCWRLLTLLLLLLLLLDRLLNRLVLASAAKRAETHMSRGLACAAIADASMTVHGI